MQHFFDDWKLIILWRTRFISQMITLCSAQYIKKQKHILLCFMILMMRLPWSVIMYEIGVKCFMEWLLMAPLIIPGSPDLWMIRDCGDFVWLHFLNSSNSVQPPALLSYHFFFSSLCLSGLAVKGQSLPIPAII